MKFPIFKCGKTLQKNDWRVYLEAMCCRCTAFFLTDINVRRYQAGRRMCTAPPPDSDSDGDLFPNEDSKRAEHPSQQFLVVGAVQSVDHQYGATWFDDQGEEQELLLELSAGTAPSRYAQGPTAYRYTDWINSEVMVLAEFEGPWKDDIPEKYQNSPMLMKYINKAVATGRGFMRRAGPDCLAMFTTIGPNNSGEVEEFIR